MKPRVLIIRESAETLTCSDCAGSLEGIDSFGSRDVPDYGSIRQIMNVTGALYRAVRERFADQIDIDVVDPRNAPYLIPTLVADYRRYRPPVRAFLKTLFLGITPASIIINGVVRYKNDLPSTEALIADVSECLDAMGQTTKRAVATEIA
jgi:hypothetical protein